MSTDLHHYTDGTLTEPFVPQEVDAVEMAFPANVMRLMPPAEKIPEDFERSGNIWVQFQSQWFYYGLDKDVEFHPRGDIDPKLALRHLACIQGSYEPTHEQKQASVAYLASLWFEKVVTPTVVYS